MYAEEKETSTAHSTITKQGRFKINKMYHFMLEIRKNPSILKVLVDRI